MWILTSFVCSMTVTANSLSEKNRVELEIKNQLATTLNPIVGDGNYVITVEVKVAKKEQELRGPALKIDKKSNIVRENFH